MSCAIIVFRLFFEDFDLSFMRSSRYTESLVTKMDNVITVSFRDEICGRTDRSHLVHTARENDVHKTAFARQVYSNPG